MSELIAFFVPGEPQTRGSKSPIALKNRDGSVRMRPGTNSPIIVTPDSNPKSKGFMQTVSQIATQHLAPGRELYKGPAYLQCIFWFSRPKSHFGTGKNAEKLKPSAPESHLSRKDLSKLIRGIEDALTGILWKDDSQVVSYERVRKYWTTGIEGTLVRVWDEKPRSHEFAAFPSRDIEMQDYRVALESSHSASTAVGQLLG